MNDLKMFTLKINELKNKKKSIYYFYEQSQKELIQIENEMNAIKKQINDSHKLLKFYKEIDDHDFEDSIKQIFFKLSTKTNHDFKNINQSILNDIDLFIDYQEELIESNERILKDYNKMLNTKKDEINDNHQEYINISFKIKNLE